MERRKGSAEHERLFDSGVELMRRGEYKMAVTAFTRATAAAPGGLSKRKGGQYAIYLAQALQAAGRKKEAVGLLKRCEAHPDADVRKISASPSSLRPKEMSCTHFTLLQFTLLLLVLVLV